MDEYKTASPASAATLTCFISILAQMCPVQISLWRSQPKEMIWLRQSVIDLDPF